jgi:O-antigen/teichoic acid export membrane protein/glycosyltransferase involved in cell wall biosynthesis
VETQREVCGAAESSWGRLLGNTAFTFLARMVAAAVALVITPLVVNTLGKELYGVWALVFLLTSYVALADLGIGAAFVRHVAEDYAKKDFPALNQVVNTGILFYLFFWLIFASLISFFLADPLLSLFKVPASIRADAHFALVGAVLVFAATNCVSVFPAVLNGLQRMDISNAIIIGHSLLTAFGTVFVLRQGLGIRGLILNAGAVFVLAASANTVSALRILPQLRVNPFLASRRSFRRLFSFGIKMQAVSAFAVFSKQFDRLLTGYALSLRYLGMYQVGCRAAEMISNLFVSIYQPVVPAASDLGAREEHERLRQLHRRGTRWLALMSVPVLAAGLVNAREAIYLWMGEGFAVSAVVLQCLLFAYSFNIVTTGMGTSMLRGLGKPETEVKTGVVFTLITVAMGIPLALRLGLAGILVTVISAQIGCSLYFIFGFHRITQWPLREFALKILLPPAASAILACAFGESLRRLLYSVITAPGKPLLLLLMLANGLLTAAACVGLLAAVRYFPQEDYVMLRKAVRRIRTRLFLKTKAAASETSEGSRGKLRIAFLLPQKQRFPGGGVKVVCEYANRLSARGHDVILILPNPQRYRREGRRSWAQRRLLHMRDHLTGRIGVEWFPVAPAVKQLHVPRVNDSSLPPCDAAIATMWQTAEWLAEISRPELRRFYLIQGYERFLGEEERIRSTWRLPLDKIVTSRWLLEIARDMGEEAHYLPPGLDFQQFSPIIIPEEREGDTVGFCYSPTSWKASNDAFSALAQVRERRPSLKVTAWGPGLKDGQIPDSVTYFPNPPQSELVNLYNRCAIFLVSSLEEGWGLPGAEAMACGCALVSTDTKGVRDYASHEETALISRPANPNELAENVLRLIQDDSLRIRLARAGQEAIRRFDWEKAAAGFEVILIGEKQRAAYIEPPAADEK